MAFGDIVQQTEGGQRNDNDLILTLASTPTEGNLLILMRGTGGSDVTTPSGWSVAVEYYDSGVDDWAGIFYKIAGASESTSVTSTSTSGTEDYGFLVEVEGPWASTGLVDDTSTPTDVDSDIYVDFDSVTTTVGDTFLAAFAWVRHGSGQVTTDTTWSNSFTERGQYDLQFKSINWASRLPGSSGTYDTSMTINSTVNTDVRFGLLAAFAGDTNPSLTLSTPSATVSGDQLLAFIVYDGTVPSTPTGWTLTYDLSWAAPAGLKAALFSRTAASGGVTDHTWDSADGGELDGYLVAMEDCSGFTYATMGGTGNSSIRSSPSLSADATNKTTELHVLVTSDLGAVGTPSILDEIHDAVGANDATRRIMAHQYAGWDAGSGAVAVKYWAWVSSASSSGFTILCEGSSTATPRVRGTSYSTQAVVTADLQSTNHTTFDRIWVLIPYPDGTSAPPLDEGWTSAGTYTAATATYDLAVYQKLYFSGDGSRFQFAISGSNNLPGAAIAVLAGDLSPTIGYGQGSSSFTLTGPSNSETDPRLRVVLAISGTAQSSITIDPDLFETWEDASLHSSLNDASLRAMSWHVNLPGDSPVDLDVTTGSGTWMADLIIGAASGGPNLPRDKYLLRFTDTGSGADVIDIPQRGLNVTDSGAGAEDQTVTVGLSQTDSGSGADATGEYADAAEGDSGSGTDAIAGIGSILNLPDSGTGADATTPPLAGLTVADAGNALTAIGSILNLLGVVQDAGSGSDLISDVAQILLLADAGSGADALDALASLLLTDSGSGADVVVLLQSITKLVEDLGGGTDAISAISAILQLLDAGAGSEGVTASATVSLSDLGASIGDLLVNAYAGVADAGSGADALDLPTLLAIVMDSSAGSDAIPYLITSTLLQDAGSGTDSVALAFVGIRRTVTDDGTGTEALSAVVDAFAIADAAYATDVDYVEGVVPVTDAGSALDALNVLITAIKTVTDTGSGVDLSDIQPVSVQITDSGLSIDTQLGYVDLQVGDSGTVSDALLLSAIATILDELSGTDSVSTPAHVVPVPDAATATETLTPVVSFTVQDVGESAETLAGMVSAMVVDAAAASDALPAIEIVVPVADVASGAVTVGLVSAMASVLDSAYGEVTVTVRTEARLTTITVTPGRRVLTFSADRRTAAMYALRRGAGWTTDRRTQTGTWGKRSMVMTKQ